MSVYLIASSLVTTLLIPAGAFEDGGAANGRALAYLAHRYLGGGFGTAYDVSTILILWFAGASAMAGMLNLIPRYLPRYGMSPEWAGAVRPLVLVLTGVAFLITWIFDADVNAQGGAYATGVLVLMTSAAVAVTLAARRAGQRRLTAAFSLIALVLVYTTLDNVRERPDGVKIGACFIVAIVLGVAAVPAGTRLRAPHHRDRLQRARRGLPARLLAPLHQARRQRARCPRRRGVPREGPRRSSTTTTCPTPGTSSSSRSPSVTTPTSRAGSRSTARSCTTTTASSPSPERRCPTRWPRSCSTSGTGPVSAPTSTSSGPREIPSLNLLRFLLFGVGEVAPSPARCCDAPSPIAGAGPTCTPGESRTISVVDAVAGALAALLRAAAPGARAPRPHVGQLPAARARLLAEPAEGLVDGGAVELGEPALGAGVRPCGRGRR